jgi:hypothetical protein
MNRSNKGFGLTGVIVTVIVLTVAAMFSASAKSSTITQLPQIAADALTEQPFKR